MNLVIKHGKNLKFTLSRLFLNAKFINKNNVAILYYVLHLFIDNSTKSLVFCTFSTLGVMYFNKCCIKIVYKQPLLPHVWQSLSTNCYAFVLGQKLMFDKCFNLLTFDKCFQSCLTNKWRKHCIGCNFTQVAKSLFSNSAKPIHRYNPMSM